MLLFASVIGLIVFGLICIRPNIRVGRIATVTDTPDDLAAPRKVLSQDLAKKLVSTKELKGLSKAQVIAKFGRPTTETDRKLSYHIQSTFSILFGSEDIYLDIWFEDGAVSSYDMGDR